MNFIGRLVDSFVAFVQRNPILCLFILLLALASPALVAGVFKVILYTVMFFILMILLGGLYMSYRINKLRRQAEEHTRGGNGTYSRTTYRDYGSQPKQSREGEVSVHQTEPQEKKINKNVGDYVDFEDVGPKK